MRLINCEDTTNLFLIERFGGNIPPYAILSHTWGQDRDELTYKDMIEHTGQDKPGFHKIKFCAEKACQDGLGYVWIDTCCINKDSSAELSEAIISMYRWYRNAAKYYVFLADVTITSEGTTKSRIWEPAFRDSRWFTRGWTLQELLAPE